MTTTSTHPPGTRAAGAGGWFKSSRSGPAGECVEINFDQPGVVRIRDSKDRGEGPTITITSQQWATVLDELDGGAPTGTNGTVTVQAGASETILLHATNDGTTLTFTQAEWRAFLDGVRAREFDHPAMSLTPSPMPSATT